MKLPLLLALSTACLSSCISFDPLDRAAAEADRQGSAAARQSGGIAPLDAAFDVVENLYYSKKYPGSEEQIRLAKARGRAAMAAWRSSASTSGAQHRTPSTSTTGKARYLVCKVGTEAASGSTQVAVFDTQTSSVVGKQIYEVSSPPTQGTRIKFDTYLAEYVGK